MRIANTILIALLIVIGCGSCRMVDTLTGNSKAGTVDSLWPDVPPLAGATKTDLALPLGARLMIRAAMQGKVSFIAFTTAQSAQEVQDFYSKERMKSSGWIANDRGCISDTEDQKSQGALCLSIARMGKRRKDSRLSSRRTRRANKRISSMLASTSRSQKLRHHLNSLK
jgi:hypothetical protein